MLHYHFFSDRRGKVILKSSVCAGAMLLALAATPKADAACTVTPSSTDAGNGVITVPVGGVVDCASGSATTASFDGRDGSGKTIGFGVILRSGATLTAPPPIPATGVGPGLGEKQLAPIFVGSDGNAGAVSLSPGATIEATGDKNQGIVAVGNNVIIANGGTITAFAEAIQGQTPGNRASNILVRNAGEIVSIGRQGDSTIKLGDDGRLINTGRILRQTTVGTTTSTGKTLVEAIQMDGGVLTNEGIISLDVTGTQNTGTAVNLFGGATVENSGTINATVPGGVLGSAITLGAGGGTVNNAATGVIDGRNVASAIDGTLSAGTIDNAGQILGSTATGFAIDGGTSTDDFKLIWRPGSVVEGEVRVTATTSRPSTPADVGLDPNDPADQAFFDSVCGPGGSAAPCTTSQKTLPQQATVEFAIDGPVTIDPAVTQFTGINTFVVNGNGILNLSQDLQAVDAPVDTSTGNVPAGDFGGNLTFNTMGAGSRIEYSGAISDAADGSNPGNVVKQGPGTLELNGNSTFSGSLSLEDGTTVVNGTLTPSFTSVQSAATLAGTGTTRNLTVNGGTVAPGNSIGTLNITGDADFTSGGTLRAEVDPNAAQNADLLAVSGGLTGTDAMTIEVQPVQTGLSAQDYVAGNNYTVVTAASIDGNAPTLVEGGNLPAIVSPFIVGTPTTSGQIDIGFQQLNPTQLGNKALGQTGSPNHASFTTAIGTAAQQNPNTALTSGAVLGSTITNLNNNQLAQLNSVHGEAYSSYLTVGLEQLDLVSKLILDRASGERANSWGGTVPGFGQGPEVSQGLSAPLTIQDTNSSRLWFDAVYVTGQVDGDNGLGNFDYDLSAFLFGGDIYEDGPVTAGLYAGFGNIEMDEHDVIDQDFDGDTYHIGAYGSYFANNGWTFSGVIGYSYTDNDTSRDNDDVGGFTGGEAEASFDSQGVFAGVRANTQYKLANGLTLTPLFDAVYAYVDQDEVTETGGGDFNYTINDADAEAFITSVGLNATHEFQSGSTRMAATGFARYHYDWIAASDDENEVTVSSPIFGSFDQFGQNRGKQAVTLGLGLAAQVADNVQIAANYGYTWNSNGEEQGFGAFLTARW
ncbi:autotransporter outer membrane beta-barrel domain-containing protein [Ruegeria atlantica]|uniref:Extracellular serine protease n=1 Tax=Ruegeria atlantica TaxID=81569 RepID=A0A0P1EFP0_9RHOB|nr:autotransporter outer membrane beta-barrel domain-containing protein [Ruegeria atlantica]CUH48954.1 Extracellular serine protease precursor [Ruegeria atlantica]